MVHPLYWVAALTCTITLGLILFHDRKELDRTQPEEYAFHRLIIWVLFFCLQDVVWGICAGTNAWGNVPLFLSSTVFHASTVITTCFWLNYVLIFLGDSFRHRRLYLGLDIAVIIAQLCMLTVNFFVPTIFSVRDGVYCTEFLRPLAFFNQYVVYLLIGGLMLVRMHLGSGEIRSKAFTVFCFSLAPILTGVFQLLYPDAPFYSIGYFLGTIIIHLFIVQNNRVQLRSLHHEMENQANRLKIAEQITLSNTDILTGLRNRRAYEEALAAEMKRDDFVYVSVDINELKTVNDTLGHAAGDELLLGAAECLRSTLGKYGEVFRIGGDEFAALLHTDCPISTLAAEMTTGAAQWQGEQVKALFLSFGFAEQRTYPKLSIQELGRIADSRMYAHKTAYYTSKGFDRRRMQMAYTALCTSYEKILRVDLTHDTFQIIAMNGTDLPDYTNETSISGWLEHFGKGGMVHPEDMGSFLSQTDLQTLRAYFAAGGRSYALFYRRRADESFHQAMMEIMPAEDYREDLQSVYLYVKNIDQVR